jgi:hypothetical protein
VVLNGAWRAIIRANGGDPGKVAEGANHLIVCLPLAARLSARRKGPPTPRKKPYPPQEQQYEGDAGFAPRNSPRRDFETNAFPSMERRCAPQVMNSAYFGALLRSRVDRDLFRRWSAKNLVERRTTRVLASKGWAHEEVWARARAGSDGWFNTVFIRGTPVQQPCSPPGQSPENSENPLR